MRGFVALDASQKKLNALSRSNDAQIKTFYEDMLDHLEQLPEENCWELTKTYMKSCFSGGFDSRLSCPETPE